MRIAVIGVGTIGVQAVYHLARRGVTVVGYEQFTIGHAFGSAGGDSRFFSRVEIKDPRYSEVIARAEELWRDFNGVTGLPLLDFTGGVMIGDPDTVEMQRAIESVQLTSSPRYLTSAEASVEYPDILLNSGEITIFDPNAGRIDPELAITLTARLAAAAGAEIRSNAQVLEITPNEGGIGVRDQHGWETFDRVIVSAGAWTTKLLGADAPETALRRLTSAWYFPATAPRFASIVPFMRVAPDYVYGIPSPDGRAVKIGLGFEDHYDVDDPDTVNRWLPPGCGLEVFRSRLEYFPGISREPFRVGTYFETYSPGRREYFRELPACDDVLILTGFSGHGFKVSPAIGEAAADWSMGRKLRYPGDVFTA